MIINLNSDYELGEHKELSITVFLPKDSTNHLGYAEKLELFACKILNDYYCEAVKKEHWKADQLWFKPSREVQND